MHCELHRLWQQVITTRGEAEALVDAESGRTLTFLELEAQALQWLEQHAGDDHCIEARGAVWCLAMTDRMDWMVVFLAAIKAGAVVLPIEAPTPSAIIDKAHQFGASILVADSGVNHFDTGRRQPGYFLNKLTSGTTGDAKLLPFTEKEMLSDGAQIMSTMEMTEADSNFALIPLGHSYALGNLVMPFFMSGIPIVMGSSPFPQVVLEELKRFPATILPIVPPIVKALSLAGDEDGAFRHVRLVISAGSQLMPKVAQGFLEATGNRVHNFYGSSETGGICFDRLGHQCDAKQTVGTALDGVELSISESQEIHVSSAAVCRALYPEGVCLLHDYGWVDDTGFLQLTGRHKDIIKISGRRVSISEIESVLSTISGVSDAFVTSRTGRSGEARLVALFSGALSPDTVREELAEHLPRWKLPKYLRRVDEISYTARGKKDRATLEGVVDAISLRS
jgi:acyl-coenzyme A synthetase/AMP-(fatty) acid ligase